MDVTISVHINIQFRNYTMQICTAACYIIIVLYQNVNSDDFRGKISIFERGVAQRVVY